MQRPEYEISAAYVLIVPMERQPSRPVSNTWKEGIHCK